MKKLTLTLAVVATLGMAACTGQANNEYVPVNLGRTAGQDGAMQRQVVRVEPVRTETRADRTYNNTMTK